MRLYFDLFKPQKYHVEAHACPNCENEYSGLVCNNCGQVPIREDLTARGMVRYWWNKRLYDFYHFFHTLLWLVRDPGRVWDDYLQHKRIRWYNAPNFFFVTAAIAAFVTLQFSDFDREIVADRWDEMYAQWGVPQNSEAGARAADAFGWMQHHYNLVLILGLPLIALASRMAFPKKRFGHGYGPHLILSFYLYGLYTLILLPILPYIDYSDPGSYATLLTSLLMVGVYAYGYAKSFELSPLGAIGRSLLMYFFYWLLIIGVMIATFIVTAIVVFIAVMLKKAGVF